MVKIAEIVTQNPWWRSEEEFVKYDQNLSKAKPIFFERRQIGLKKGGIYILRGPRQVGKTTYIKDMIRRLIEKGVPSRSMLYLSLDFFVSRREMKNAIDYFLDLTRDFPQIFIFLDEITSIDDWNLELKRMADQGITQRAVILATGSSAIKLKETGELLPGRGVEGNEYYMKPLSFRRFVLQSTDWIVDCLPEKDEFRNALKRLKPVLNDCSIDLSYGQEDIKREIQKILPFKRELSYLFGIYLVTGGLPGVINHYLDNHYLKGKDMIEPIVSEIFIRDVLGDMMRLQKQEIITRQMLKAIMDRYGSRYSFSKLSHEIERTHITTIDYLEYLEDSFISFVLYAYDFNKKYPKLKGDKKVYFFDPLVFHSVKSYLTGEEISGVINKTRQDEELQSKIVEGVVISHLLMHREIPFLRIGKTFLWYYYDKSGREMDAVCKENSRYLGIEVKFQSRVSEKEIKAIAPVKQFIILSKEDIGGNGETAIIPVDLFLAQLSLSERNV